MPAIPHIKKKIGNSYLVWFQNTNSYVKFEEPAWFVFQKTLKKYKPEDIIEDFSLRYDADKPESRLFVSEIQSKIEILNQTDHSIIAEPVPDKIVKFHFIPFSVHHYRFGSKIITFYYETKEFEYYLHPLISHLETEEAQDETSLFELFGYDHHVVFRLNGTIKGIWKHDETHLVKGLVFLSLASVMHQKTDSDWLMTVHASAITNQRKTILFSAPPGHGKTTIAALLQARGYQLVSDDFVPIDKNRFCAFPFPIAMSVKEGSVEVLYPHFKDLKEKQLNFISQEKSVRYLTPKVKNDYLGDIFPVKDFIFVEYSSNVHFAWEKLELTKAIQLLLEQVWINPVKENIRILFDQIRHISFYKLTYSKNKRAIAAITHLFKNE